MRVEIYLPHPPLQMHTHICTHLKAHQDEGAERGWHMLICMLLSDVCCAASKSDDE